MTTTRLLVAQSGGATAVINSSLVGVVEAARAAGLDVLGARRGIEGILAGDLVDLGRQPQTVLDHLRRLKQEFALTTILVSHQYDEVAALADAVARIGDGRLSSLADVDAFMASAPAPAGATLVSRPRATR